MRIEFIVWLPALAAAWAFWAREKCPRLILAGTAVLHLFLTGLFWAGRPEYSASDYLGLDVAGLLFLTIISVLFLAASLYSQDYLARHEDSREGFFWGLRSEAVYSACMLLFLFSMTLVAVSQHFGLMWVALEATTLVTAPLVCFRLSARSLEAAWKYLILCSIGIALALLGNFALQAACPPNLSVSLTAGALLSGAGMLNGVWLKTAFVFAMVGYGTKAGLAPMHTWLPDAHSEAPSPVSALLSGALLNCALLIILRFHGVALAAGLGGFSGNLLKAFGLASLAAAAVFLLRQKDYKRMLAYSSVENMGIIALGAGLGGAAAYGALLHAVFHSLAKAALFFTSGNILSIFKTKEIQKASGLMRVDGRTGWLWLAGFAAITGTPPSGMFLSKFAVLKGAFDSGGYFTGAAYLFFIALIFMGMAKITLNMLYDTGGQKPSGPPLRGWSFWVPAALLALVAAGLFYIPGPLVEVLKQAAAFGRGAV